MGFIIPENGGERTGGNVPKAYHGKNRSSIGFYTTLDLFEFLCYTIPKCSAINIGQSDHQPQGVHREQVRRVRRSHTKEHFSRRRNATPVFFFPEFSSEQQSHSSSFGSTSDLPPPLSFRRWCRNLKRRKNPGSRVKLGMTKKGARSVPGWRRSDIRPSPFLKAPCRTFL